MASKGKDRRAGLPSEIPLGGTPEGRWLRTVVRSRMEALKFVPEYVEAWDALEARHGRAELLDALRTLRASLPIPSPEDDVVLSLANLAPTSRVGPLGPVDPHDPEDPEDLEALIGSVNDLCAPTPFWFLECLGLRGRWPPIKRDGGWVAVELDLEQNKKVLRLALDVFWEAGRAELGIEQSLRVLGRGEWEDDLGPRTAFRLYRAASQDRKRSQRAHGMAALEGRYTEDRTDKEASDLMAEARARIKEERTHFVLETRVKQLAISRFLASQGPDRERRDRFIAFLQDNADLCESILGIRPPA